MEYGAPSWRRLALAAVFSALGAVGFVSLFDLAQGEWTRGLWRGSLPFLGLLWGFGVVFRLRDVGLRGMARTDRSWVMSRATWVWDFSLRGYLSRGVDRGGDQPLVS